MPSAPPGVRQRQNDALGALLITAFLDHLEHDRGSSAQAQRAARRDSLAVRFAVVLRSGMVTNSPIFGSGGRAATAG